MAWAILEDIALDAHLNDHGRLVATTNVRRIADNLGVSKNTVATHLARLRDAGFVLHEEGDHDDTGRYTVSRYVLDPSACVERFTHTPARNQRTVTDDPDIPATDEGTRSGEGVPADIDAHDNPTATDQTGPVVDSRADDVETLVRPEFVHRRRFRAVYQILGHGCGHRVPIRGTP